jgi:prepilin-type N-terminal cleavage/methylation domain-containing protein
MSLTPTRCGATGRTSHARRAGVTLVELLVVLVIVGLATTVVVPAVRVPEAAAASQEDPLRVAQRLAVQRGEALALTVQADGPWVVTRSAQPDDTISTGRSAPSVVGTMSILPTGACLPVALSATRGAWDPISCEWQTAVATP